MDRRSFLSLAGGALAASTIIRAPSASAAEASKGRAIPRLGLQLFTVPVLLEKDLEAGLKQIAQIGYKELELFGPYPFSTPAAQESWRAVTKMLNFTQSGYFGRTAKEFRALLDRNGLSSPSMHIDFGTLHERLDQVAEAAHIVGQRHIGISSLPADRRRTPDDFRRAADEFNELGARMARHGLHFLYHNHGYGLRPVDGRVPLKLLIEHIDPKVVSLEMDVFWTTAGGADPAALLDEYPGRYKLIHLKDMKELRRFEGDGGDPSQWVKLFPYMTNAGQGVLDVANIVAHARKAGVEHFYVEYDQAADPIGTLKANKQFLAALQG
jgi:sugar phosphate isomerase/epimerase